MSLLERTLCSVLPTLRPESSFPLRRCWEGGQWGLWPFTGGCCWLASPSLPPPQKYPFLYDKQRLHLQQESPQSSLSFCHLRNRFNYPVQSPTSRGVYTLVYFFLITEVISSCSQVWKLLIQETSTVIDSTQQASEQSSTTSELG